MKVPKRFALSPLLMAMFAVAMVFGYAQWRRQWLKNAVVEFNKVQGTDLAVSDNLFWPTAVPRKVILTFTQDVSGQLVRFGKEYSYSEVNSVAVKLMAMGVDEVWFDLNRENGQGIFYERIPLGAW